MGADGGSIPKRCELVRQAKQPPTTTTLQKNARQDKWRQCALSHAELSEPIVADRLGRLYNKDAMIQALLQRKLEEKTFTEDNQKGEGLITHKLGPIGHIQSLKDLFDLSLTRNPSTLDLRASTAIIGFDNHHLDALLPPALFICPLTRKEMDGTMPFLFHPDCGCVLSELALKTLTKVLFDWYDESLVLNCPSCDTVCHGPWIPLNGTPEQQKILSDKLGSYKKKERSKKRRKLE